MTWIVVGGLAFAFVFGYLINGVISRASAESCGSREKVSMVVAPQAVSAVRGAVEEVAQDCVDVTVTSRAGAAELERIRSDRERPDIWIPDTSNQIGDLFLGGVQMEQLSASVASTPIAVVGRQDAEQASTWGELLQTKNLELPDPQYSGVGATAIVAPHAEAVKAGQNERQASAYLVPLAQRFGERRAAGNLVRVDLADLATLHGKGRLVTSEYELATARSAFDFVDVTPKSGTMLMRFPMVTFEGATAGTKDLGKRLATYFKSEDGIKALNASGLRGPKGQGSVKNGTKAKVLPELTAEQTYDDQATWRRLGIPSSVLAVVDVSGSMDFPAGDGQTRIQLASSAAVTALQVFPNHSRIGLWAFSINQGGPGQDWRDLVPVRRLDTNLGSVNQRQLLASEAPNLEALTYGGTGLYDTALASYKHALKTYNKNYSNAVVLITDGSNDDPGSIELPKLLKQLQSLRSEERPVRIIGIAISQDADVKSLRQISEATGGETYYAKKPTDLISVLSKAISSR